MRKVMLMLAVMAVALVAASGLALAVERSGGAGNDRIVGTDNNDTLSGGGGNDDIFGKGARDRIHGDSGADDLMGNSGRDELYGDDGDDDYFGGPGNDFINAVDERPGELVDCGGGLNDRAVIDSPSNSSGSDIVQNCENVFVVTAGGGMNLTAGSVDEAVAAGTIESQ